MATSDTEPSSRSGLRAVLLALWFVVAPLCALLPDGISSAQSSATAAPAASSPAPGGRSTPQPAPTASPSTSPVTPAQPVPATAQTGPLPTAFFAGERLTYELAWSKIKAGTAVMSVDAAEPQDGRMMYKLTTVARSSSLLTKFYPVDNRVESWIDAVTQLPQHMQFHRREGKRRNEFDYVFHQAAGKVEVVKDGQRAELDILQSTHDAISCLYATRAGMPLTPGTSALLNVHHDKKNYKLEVRVEGVDRLEGPWGIKDAARLLVVMPFQGIFLNEGNVRVWVTTDDRRVPLLMKAKVIVGAVTATLADGF